jgi:hypothetical protein
MIIFIIPINSFAASNIDRVPLVNREPRISSLGFSFIPPPGTNWLEEFGENQITYIKKMEPIDGTLFGTVTELQTQQTFPTPDALKHYITNKRKSNTTPPRYANTKTSYSLQPGIAPFCVRYLEQFEDWGAKNLYGRSFLVIMNHGLICLHPDNPKVLVDIYFSYRYPPDNKDKKLISEGEELINSLKMLRPNKP